VITIEIANDQSRVSVDESRLRDAVGRILREEAIRSAEISLAVVDDATLQKLHHEYLDDDTPTDVMSFVLDRDAGHLAGEVVASADTAVAAAEEFGWSADDELLLYIIHGTLHLVGYDDTTPEARSEMRERERRHLARFDLKPRYEEDAES
jgi:probable rRNA maturation factor